MSSFRGNTLSWTLRDGVYEVALHHPPCNEIGSETLVELEKLAPLLENESSRAHALILHSEIAAGFSAGADLRELYEHSQAMVPAARMAGVRDFLRRIHAVLNALDAAALVTIAGVHGVTFGGGFELALACDLMIADRSARFCFPELRLGLIPGFGGIPRLKRDLGNAVVRDLLLTGRSINAARAHAVGLVSQLVAEGEALRISRITAEQIGKFDRTAAAAAKRFIKPIPQTELEREIEIFCELFARPACEEGLKKFVESSDALPYLP